MDKKTVTMKIVGLINGEQAVSHYDKDITRLCANTTNLLLENNHFRYRAEGCTY